MMRCKIVFLTFCVLLTAAGCGYHIGVRDMMHPQIKSIAIAPVQNNTIEPLAADVLRMQLAGEFQRDGALKLKRTSNADCIIYAVINSVQNRLIDEASYDGGKIYEPDQFRLQVHVSFKVVIPGSGNALVNNGTAVGSAVYEILADPATARATALKYACYHAAQSIVEQTTEAW